VFRSLLHWTRDATGGHDRSLPEIQNFFQRKFAGGVARSNEHRMRHAPLNHS
jgi:hypothetical protein